MDIQAVVTGKGCQAPCPQTPSLLGLGEGLGALGISKELPHPRSCCCHWRREVSTGTRWEQILQLQEQFMARSG